MILDNKNRELCNKCNAVANFEPNYGYYSCPACENAWAYAEDDPDLDELVAASCIFYKSGDCTNNMKSYPRCEDCPRRDLN